MKVLIIGGRSSVAQAVIGALDDDIEVVTAGRAGCDVELDLSVGFESADLMDGMDIVVNTAAAFGGQGAEELELAIRVNILAPVQLCRLATQAGVGQLVHISSIYATLSPTSPFYGVYASSKRQGDEMLERCAALEGLPVCVLRPSRLYGVGEDSRKHQPFLSSIIGKARRHEEIVFYGRNDARRNFLHLQDLAKMVARVIDKRVGGTYSCTQPHDIACSALAEAAIEAFQSRSTIRFDHSKPDIADDDFLRDNQLYDAIGYDPMITFAKGMQMEAAHQDAT